MGGVSELQILGLGAFAGLTILLGMPIARAKGFSDTGRVGLSALAAGILMFLFYDVLKNAHELVLAPFSGSPSNGPLTVEYSAVLIAGFAGSMAALLAFEMLWLGRMDSAKTESQGIDPLDLSTMIAVGIGLHNFAEGLAIGTAFAAGLSLALVLVIGFAIHNATEGFGILGPGMLAGSRYSVRRLLALGLVGGGPTFFGTAVGSFVSSDAVSILFYGLAAGAILYVVLQMARPMLARPYRPVATAAIAIGFALGFVTDLVVTFGGA